MSAPTGEDSPVLDSEAISELVTSHEKVLFGYPDRNAMRYIPGLLQQRKDDHDAILEVQTDVRAIKEEIKGVPELLELVKSIRRWGLIGMGAYALWQFASWYAVAPLKSLIPDILRAWIAH